MSRLAPVLGTHQHDEDLNELIATRECLEECFCRLGCLRVTLGNLYVTATLATVVVEHEPGPCVETKKMSDLLVVLLRTAWNLHFDNVNSLCLVQNAVVQNTVIAGPVE